MEPQKTQNCQSNPEEKEQSRRHNLPRLQTTQNYSNQNMILAGKQTYGSMEQTRGPTNKPTYLQSINRQQTRQQEEVSLASGVGKAGQPNVLEYTLTSYIKINSKWLKDLTIRHNTIKLLEENIGKRFSVINHSNVFLVQSPKVIEIKAKINNWDLIKLISFCIAKETVSKTKTTYRMGENI